MCVDYYVDNVDNVDTKLHIMFMGNPINAENKRKTVIVVDLLRNIMLSTLYT